MSTTAIDTHTKIIDGYTVTVSVYVDEDMGPPWKQHDGHGPVSEWTTRKKRPGERMLNDDKASCRFYDWQEAIVIAKRDNWGIPDEAKAELSAKLKREPTKDEITAEAVRRDFEYLRGWCNDEWQWHGYETTITGPDGVEHEGDSCWGFDDSHYMITEAFDNATSTIEDLKAEAVKAAEAEARRQKIVRLARENYAREGDLEFDNDAKVSEGDDNGAYVQCWKWFPFTGTSFDKAGEEKQLRVFDPSRFQHGSILGVRWTPEEQANFLYIAINNRIPFIEGYEKQADFLRKLSRINLTDSGTIRLTADGLSIAAELFAKYSSEK